MSLNERVVTAVLGPTNTGKTHYAIERMLAYPTGVIGLPLRLLAREVYERIRALRGPSVVALVTGEERIVPERTRYWVCTVEAMPTGIGADFLAVDEIQLAADAERGHVFTDRLLHARGLRETLFLGAETMRPTIAALVEKVQFQHRARLSALSYTGARKISRMRPRSAIVGFSVENVYAIAELLRRQKGGAAVVMGALSPRTRNAQVALYQNGDVDYLVATDAIGMGLNLDIDHVAFSGLEKFDGRRMRRLGADEMAQIAGRAGRYMNAGTFGVTGEAPALSEDMVGAIEAHCFAPLRHLQWRSRALEFASTAHLVASLEAPSGAPLLARTREADDLKALKALADLPEVRDRLSGPADVRLLWDICQVPDFCNVSAGEHAALLSLLHGFLHGGGGVPDDWLAKHIRRIDRTDGDIDTLSKRLADIRTWTFVAQRKGWVRDENHWRGETRAVEDRLSDALHARLTQRFVDRRTSVLMRRLKQKESLVAEVNDKGEVTVEGQFVGRLEGFRFHCDESASADEARTLRAAATQALGPQFHLRADRFYNAPDTDIDFTAQGLLVWGGHEVGRLAAGDDPLAPRARPIVDDEAGADVTEKVGRRLQHFIDRKVAALFEPLMALKGDEALTGQARGFAYRLVEAMGVLARASVADEVKALDQEMRGALRKHGVRFGQYTIFMPLLLKPAATRLRLVLWSLGQGRETGAFADAPPPGLVTVPAVAGAEADYYRMSGYRLAGERAIRIDMLERLADMLRGKNSRGGFEAAADMLSITGMTLLQFADLMQGLGYRAVRGERVKARPKAAASAKADDAIPDKADAGPAEAGEAAAAGGASAAPVGEGGVASAGAGGATPAGAEEATPPEAGEATSAEGAVPEEAGDADTAGAEEAAPAEAAQAQTTPAQAPPTETASVEAAQAVTSEAPAVEAVAPPPAAASPDDTSLTGADAPAPEQAPRTTVEKPETRGADETEIFFTFTWAPRRRQGGGKPPEGASREGGAPREGGKPRRANKPGQSGKPRAKGRKPGAKEHSTAPATFSARPPKKDKPIDPDNPFAALLALKDKS